MKQKFKKIIDENQFQTKKQRKQKERDLKENRKQKRNVKEMLNHLVN